MSDAYRKRQQTQGRDFICPCGKTYLSYPALFTHIKQKHDGKPPGEVIRPRPGSRPSRPPVPQPEPLPPLQSETEQPAHCITVLLGYIERKLGRQASGFQLDDSDPFVEYYLRNKGHPAEGTFNEAEGLTELTCDEALVRWLAQVEARDAGGRRMSELVVFASQFHRALADKFGEDFAGQQRVKDVIEISNELCTSYFPQYREEEIAQGRLNLAEEDGVVLVKAFFDWLYVNKFTNHKLKLAEDEKAADAAQQ